MIKMDDYEAEQDQKIERLESAINKLNNRILHQSGYIKGLEYVMKETNDGYIK